jgi:hypothetical protein
MTLRAAGCFSCVVDEPPRFHLDALRWFACLTRVTGVKATDLIVHVVGDDTSVALDYLRTNGVTVDLIERFDSRSPHCNKIAGALRLAADHPASTVVLCDADVAILEDPRQLPVAPGGIVGKPVDAPNPPLEVLQRIFSEAGVTPPETIPLPWGQAEQTLRGHYNGGLYLVHGQKLEHLATSWSHWARWLLDRHELLGDWTTYIDQAAMTLAVTAQGFETDLLDVRWNTPTHDLERIPADAPAPAVLHYHDRVNGQGRLRKTGVRAVDRRIEAANEAIAAVWKEVFGTGGGGQPLRAEERWRRTLVEALRPRLILELSDGPSDPPRSLAPSSGSPNNRQPNEIRHLPLAALDTLSLAAPSGEGRTAADVIILEVPPEMPTVDLSRMLRTVWDRTGQSLVINSAGTETDGPESRQDGPLWSVTKAAIDDAELYPVERHGSEVTTIVALRSDDDRHPRDFSPASLASVVTSHPDPLVLMEIRLHARKTTGFYPDHPPRLWEYPVVATIVQERLSPGSRLIDVGAGVSPLAPFLAANGFVVDTVDPSPRKRRWPPDASWNEWDFLDYRRAGLAHRSWNRTLDRIPRRLRYDGILSVSVIEHLPGSERRSLLAEMAHRTRADGLIVLTIDLVRGSEALWNRNLGVEVEELAAHGSLDDVVAEAGLHGLALVERQVVRNWADVDVDIGLLVLQQRVSAIHHE